MNKKYVLIVLMFSLHLSALNGCSNASGEKTEKQTFPGLESEKALAFQDPKNLVECEDGNWKLQGDSITIGVRCHLKVWNNDVKANDGYDNFMICPDGSRLERSVDLKTAWCLHESMGIRFSKDGQPSRCEKSDEGLWSLGEGDAKSKGIRCKNSVWGNVSNKGDDGLNNFILCPPGTSTTFSEDRRFAWCQGVNGDISQSTAGSGGNLSRCSPEGEGAWAVLHASEGEAAIRCFSSIWHYATPSTVDGQVNSIFCRAKSKVKFSDDRQLVWCEDALGRLDYQTKGHSLTCSSADEGTWRMASSTSSSSRAFRCNDGEWGGEFQNEFFCPIKQTLEIGLGLVPVCMTPAGSP